MPIQELNADQRAHVQTSRQHVEEIFMAHARLAAYVDEADNQQSPIAATTDELGDDDAGTAPRTDAPVLTGAFLAQLRSFSALMAAHIDGAPRNLLIQNSVRDVVSMTRDI